MPRRAPCGAYRRPRSRMPSSTNCAVCCAHPRSSSRTWRAARHSMGDITEAEVREALGRLDPLWEELFPAEQARIVQLLVERVDVSPDGADIRLRTEGLANLVADLRADQTGIPEGGVMTEPNLTGDGRTITVRVPISIRRRGGRKLVVAPDGTTDTWAAAQSPDRQRHGQSDCPRVPLARDAGKRRRTRPSPRSRPPRRSTSPMSAACCG